MVKIIVAGDLVPTESNYPDFMSGNLEKVIDKLVLNKWFSADCRIFNLEAPIYDKFSPIAKCGPNLRIPTKAVAGLKFLQPSVICLANNHIMDQGKSGFDKTLNILIKNNLNFTGAGKNIADARKKCILKVKDKKIGLYCCSEHEFSIAEQNKPGANPYDELNTFLDIKSLARETDIVIVLYHGGREHYRYPSPLLQERCYRMAEAGAKIVICQHSHCIGCRECYKNCEIIYGQGNFLFDYNNIDCWQTGLLIEIEIKKNITSYNYIPIVKKSKGISLANQIKYKEIINEFDKRSVEIMQKEFVKKNYLLEAQKCYENYFNVFSCFKDKYAIINYLECESHREIFLFALKNCELPDNYYKFSKKIFNKIKFPNGKCKIYFLGFKIFSYKNRKVI